MQEKREIEEGKKLGVMKRGKEKGNQQLPQMKLAITKKKISIQ